MYKRQKLEGPAGTFSPGLNTIRKIGYYKNDGDHWLLTGLDAPAGNLDRPYKFPVRQSLPSTPLNKTVTFTAPDEVEIPYKVDDPFDGVLRIEMQIQDLQPRPNRYVVVMADAVSGNDIPETLRVGSNTYALTPVPGATNHSFQTPVIPAQDRVSATVLERGMDLKFADDVWSNGPDGVEEDRTLEQHDVAQSIQQVVRGTELPTDPFLFRRFELTHNQVINNVNYPPDNYIWVNGWYTIAPQTEAALTVFIHAIVVATARVGNTDVWPLDKIDYAAIKEAFTTFADARYLQPGGTPFPSGIVIDDANIGASELATEETTGNHPHRVLWNFPAWNDPAWVPQPGQSSHGYTTGEAIFNNPAYPFHNRATYFSPTYHTRTLNDRFRFELNPHASIETPVSIGIAAAESGGAELRLSCSADSHGNWTTDPVGSDDARPDRTGEALWVQLYDAPSRPLIIDPEQREHRHMKAKKLSNSRQLWRYGEGGNKPYIDTSLGHTQPANEFHNPGGDPEPLAIDDFPDEGDFQVRIKLGARTGIIASQWLPCSELKALPDLATVAGGQTQGQAVTTAVSPRVLQSIVPSSNNIDYHQTPNCYYFNIRGQDDIYFGNWGGSLSFRFANWPYLAHVDSDIWIYVRGWDD